MVSSKPSRFPWLFVGFLALIVLIIYNFCLLLFTFFPGLNFIPFSNVILIFMVAILLLCLFFYFFSFYKFGALLDSPIIRTSSVFLSIFYLLLIVGFSSFVAYFYSYFSGVFSDASFVASLTGSAISSLPVNFNPELMNSSGIGGLFIGMIAYALVEMIKNLPFFIKFLFVVNSLFLFCFVLSYFVFSIGLFKARKKIRFLLYAGVFRFVFVLLIFVTCGYLYTLFFRILINPDFLVGLIGSWSFYSGFLGVMFLVFLFLNLISFVLETVSLFLGHKVFE